MLTHEENELLARVGPGAPMGDMMRRYWLPSIMSSEIGEPDGTPKRVRLLGENLVAFRDTDGRVGVMDELCPHRGASLVLARNENHALQCLYHGWRIAADGAILETPCEPEESDFKDRIRHLAYPVRELGGIVWVYLGPPGTEPQVPDFAWSHLPPENVSIIKMRLECNWAQGLEGVIDSAHSNFLHSSDIVPSAQAASLGGTSIFHTSDLTRTLDRPSNDGRPRMETQDTAYGFRYAAIRKPLRDADKNKYIRVSLFAAPFYGLFPTPDGYGAMQAFVPIDDESSFFYFFQYCFTGPVNHANLAYRSGARVGIDLDENFRKIRSVENNFLQDREMMKSGKSFSGIAGVNVQDMAVQETMGRIYDRTREHLGVSDVAVIRFRRIMLDAARRFSEHGSAPPALQGPIPYDKLRAQEKIIPISDSWYPVGAFAGEPTEAGSR
ncbi:MAG: Rieske 2Fe-2S domain-containing protein [Chloroflexota bacterium]